MLTLIQEKQLGQVVAKAWSDPLFKKRLKLDPRAVLSDMGVEIPKGTEVEVLENTSEKTYLTLPLAPSKDVLFDEDLEKIGMSSTACLPGNTGCQSSDWGC